MRIVKPHKPEQRQSIATVDLRTECSRPRPDQLEAKAKAKTIEFCPQAVLEFEASHRGHHPCNIMPTILVMSLISLLYRPTYQFNIAN